VAKKKAVKNDAASVRAYGLVPVQTGGQAEAAKQEADIVARAFNSLPEVIRDDEVSTAYADFMVKLTAAKKSVDAKRRSITRHMDQAKKIVMDLFKPYADRFQGYREACDERILDYQDFLERKAEEERRKEEERERKRLARLAAAEEKKLKAAKDVEAKAKIKAAYRGKVQQVQAETTAKLEMIEEEPPEAPGVQFRTQLVIELKDINKVPEQFIERRLLEGTLRDYVLACEAATGELPKVGGVEIYRKSTTAVTGKA
jgi:hypothetical protein